MEKNKIDRINELARKQKETELTAEEKAEQLSLRREYIEAYKKSLVSQLESIRILEPDGTKHKIAPKKH